MTPFSKRDILAHIMSEIDRLEKSREKASFDCEVDRIDGSIMALEDLFNYINLMQEV